MIKRDTAEPVELNISPATVCHIISRAREFDAEVEPLDSETQAGGIDSEDPTVQQNYAGDPRTAELRSVIDDLNDDEVIDLIALAWVGRGDYSRGEWQDARALARERHRRHSAGYLMGMPTLGDYLEEGLATLGHSYES